MLTLEVCDPIFVVENSLEQSLNMVNNFFIVRNLQAADEVG